jgi:uncharacterized FlaG/YvyC family protein
MARMPEGKMSYEQVYSINKVEQDRALSAPVQIQAAQQVKAVEPKTVEAVVPDKKTETPKSAPVMTNDTSLKFIVDKNSNSITVLVVDRATQKVVRSIPPEELNQYKDGDLLSLFA